MPVNYDARVKTARMNATRTDVPSGTFELLIGTTVAATYTLTADAGSVTGSVWTLAVVNDTVEATAAGTINLARVRTSGAAGSITGLTVGIAGSGADVIVDNNVVAVGQNVKINSAAITHAA